MADPPPCGPPLLGVGSKSGDNSWPGFVPAIGTGDGPECHERIDVCTGPVHAATLQSRFDYDFIGTFGAAAANRVAGRSEGGVLHLRQTFGEVRQRAISRFSRC